MITTAWVSINQSTITLPRGLNENKDQSMLPAELPTLLLQGNPALPSVDHKGQCIITVKKAL